MPLSSPEYEVVGVSLCGVGPIREVMHLELGGGVRALYGENGIGKSFILQQVACAVRGIAPADDVIGDIHVRLIDDRDSSFMHGLRLALTEAVSELSARLLHAGASSDELRLLEEAAKDQDPDVWGHRSVDDLVLLVLLARKLSDDPASDSLVELWLDQVRSGVRLITFRASGTVHNPSWEIHLAIHPTALSSNGLDLRADLVGAFSSRVNEARFQSEVSGPLVDGDFLRGLIKDAKYLGETQLLGGLLESVDDVPAHFGEDVVWPRWLQVPVLRVVKDFSNQPKHFGFAVSVIEPNNTFSELSGQTLEHIRLNSGVIGADLDVGFKSVDIWSVEPKPVVDDSGAISEDVERSVAHVVSEANWIFETALPGSPVLRFHVGKPADWINLRLPRWQFRSHGSAAWRELDGLSSAQRRWASVAISLALVRVGVEPVVLICDEPEAGMHRLAERRLAAKLGRIAERTGAAVLVATHSPFLLTSEDVDPMHVYRRGPESCGVEPAALSLIDRTAAEWTAGRLGLSVADLVPLMRLAIVVEGVHDELVLTALLRSEIDRAAGTILPMHGGKNAPLLTEARLLIDITDAEILVVLDNLENKAVQDIWDRAAKQAASGDLSAARVTATELRTGTKSAESKYLHQLLTRALESNCTERIHIFGLGMPDIICYLPEVALLTRHNKQWNVLLDEWLADPDPKVRGINIKKWLRGRNLLPKIDGQLEELIEDVAVRAARSGIHQRHDDLNSLALEIERLSTEA